MVHRLPGYSVQTSPLGFLTFSPAVPWGAGPGWDLSPRTLGTQLAAGVGAGLGRGPCGAVGDPGQGGCKKIDPNCKKTPKP